MNVHASQFLVGSRSGLSRGELRSRVAGSELTLVGRDVYRRGAPPASPLDRALGVVIATDAVVSGHLSALLQAYDTGGRAILDATVDREASTLHRGLRHRLLAPDRIIEVAGFRCTDGLQTLVDLAHRLPDDEWEQALEFALRRRLVTVAALEAELPHLGRQRIRGTQRIRRVLLLRPDGARATESLLETYMVQIARLVPHLRPPDRQVEVYDRFGNFVARVDLAWPELGIFIELDGQHHEDQPVYDASRETAVVAATGWLCGRFTWRQCTTNRLHTARQVEGLVHQARRRPLAAST